MSKFRCGGSSILKRPQNDSRRAVLWTIAVGLVASACSQAPAPSVQADPNVSNSFAAVSPSEIKDKVASGLGVSLLGDLAYLEIRKEALDKEFLLTGSTIPQRGAPTSSGLRGRVVAFSKKGKSLFLVEATDGHVVTDSLPAELILAEIPIILETESTYVLDFNSGMNKVFKASNWFASDLDKSGYTGLANTDSMKVDLSYLNKIEVLASGHLEIRQIVQLDPVLGKNANYEIRYYLSPYVKNEAYKARETNGFDRVGYFETPPVLEKETGRSVIRNTFFDISKPVTFYVSANTPKEYQQAVIDGILYWNKAFGKEVIRAEIAPENVTAPDPGHNIVQWVEWDQAGFAYADAHMDPRTGEIKHAQVYLTSAFAWASQVRARRLIRNNEESPNRSAAEQQEAFGRHVGIKGIESSTLCLKDATPRMAQVAAQALRAGVSDETLLRLSRDYIADVVAHEIGHTLGLRHNFLGNLEANVSPKQIDERMSAYLKDATTPMEDIVPSNSVMEYQAYAESIISGQRMIRKFEALAYDKKAVRHAYLGEEVDPLNSPLFCTDSQTASFKDCVRGDRGRNPIEGSMHEMRRLVDELPMAFIEAHLSALAPLPGVPAKEIKEVSVDPTRKAAEIRGQMAIVLRFMDKESASALLVRRYHYIDSLNQDRLVPELYELVKEEAARQGGFKSMIFDVLSSEKSGVLRPLWAIDQVEAVRKALAKRSVTEFEGLAGQKVTLSPSQKVELIIKASSYFEALQQHLVKEMLGTYAAAKWTLEIDAIGDLREGGLTIALETGLAEVMPQILLKKSAGQVTVAKLQTPKFFYNHDVRKNAATLLGGSLVNLANWSKPARTQTLSSYDAFIASTLGLDSVAKIPEAIAAGNRPLQIWWAKEAPIWTLLKQ